MLIGSITGKDFETVKKQVALAEKYCDAIEICQGAMKPETDLPIFDFSNCSVYHNFEETPEDLEVVLASMPEAKFYKLATKANSILDSLRMLAFVKRHKNVAGMCMGPLGQITRILAPIVGTPFIFAALGQEAVPGQMQAEELCEVYNYRHLSPKTKIYGLIGNPVSQSPSHKTHNTYFRENGLDAVYIKIPLEEEEIPEFFRYVKRLYIRGLSVTMPYKEKLFPFIDEVEERGEEIGAINTLTFGEKISAANTDAEGALDVLEKRMKVKGKRVVILGAGGSAKAISFEAKHRGAQVFVHSRRFGNLDQIPPFDILINTIPVEIPFDLSRLEEGKVFMDICFRRQNSPMTLAAEENNCAVVLGEEMFLQQAKGQYSRWGQIPSS